MNRILLALLAAAIGFAPAVAQVTIPNATPFSLVCGGVLVDTLHPCPTSASVTGANPAPSIVGGTAERAVSNASARVAFSANTTTYPNADVTNDGTTDVWLALGDNTVAATTAAPSIYLAAGKSINLKIGASTNIAAITASGTSTVHVTQTDVPVLGYGGGGGAGGGGGGAVTVADGADVTLGAKADAKSTATDTTAVTAMQVLKQISASVQAPPSQAVTNAGTFAVQLAANQSTNTAQINGVTPLMGNGASGTGAQRVTIANDSTGVISLATGANTIGALTANQSVNIAQMNGVTTTMGNGVSGTGVQRVTIASDSTGTSIVTQATGSNLHVVCDTGCGSAASAGYSNTATFTTGTTAYAVNDAVGASGAAAAVSFTTMGPASTEVMITGVELEIDTTALISGETTYNLYTYNVTPPSAVNDSAAWTLPAGDRASFLAPIPLGTPACYAATTCYVRVDNLNIQVKLGATPTLFAYLVTNGAFTPTARVYKITVHTVAM